MAEESRKQLLASVKGLLSSGSYSDLIITCGTDSYNVHKAIVCTRADFFARADRFPVGKEAQDGKIDLPCDESAIVKLLMQYLYEGEYNPVLPSETGSQVASVIADTNSPSPKPKGKKKASSLEKDSTKKFPHSCDPYNLDCQTICPHHCCGFHCNRDCYNFVCEICTRLLPPLNGSADQLLTHAKMYEIGDKYDVMGLKELSLEKFSRACAEFWDDPMFPVAAHHAFCTTPSQDKGLRDIVSKTLYEHIELIHNPEFEALLMEQNGLAFGLLKQMKR